MAELAEARREVSTRGEACAREHADVERYRQGLWSLLARAGGGYQARLAQERREADEAAARLAEATALYGRLRGEVAALDDRARVLQGARAELEAARAEKEAWLAGAGGRESEALAALAEARARAVAQSRSTEAALAAGVRVRATLDTLAEQLSDASGWSSVDVWSGSPAVSRLKRSELDDAQTLGGHAQAELTVFQSELGELGLELLGELGELAHHQRFLDVWLDNALTDWSVDRRITRALDSTRALRGAIDAKVFELRARLAALADEAAAIEQRRLALLEAPAEGAAL